MQNFSAVKRVIIILGLILARSAGAQALESQSAENDAVAAGYQQRAAIDRLEIQVETLRGEVAAAREETRRTQQQLDRLLGQTNGPRNSGAPTAPPAYSAAVRNALGDLSDCEQQLISGDLFRVEERLLRARDALEGAPAGAVDAALEALSTGNLGDARGLLLRAIGEANALY